MNFQHTLVAAAVGAAALATTPARADLVLVQDGQPRSIIVTADDASPSVRDAARDLQYFVHKSSGAELRIVAGGASADVPEGFVEIHLGAGPAAEAAGVRADALEPEQYRIKTDGGRIIIVGHDLVYGTESQSVVNRSPATVWGVNYLLDRYVGVRWLWPGDVGTYIPKRRTITIPDMDVTRQPVQLQRQLPMRWGGRNPKAEADASPGAYRFLITPQEQAKLVEESLDWQERHQMGERFRFGGVHSFTDWWKKYSETNPDFFAVPPPGIENRVTEPDRVKLRIGNPAVAAKVVEEWKAAGSPDIWGAGENDGKGFDTSPESRALDVPQHDNLEDIWFARANLTARYVHFWNTLLREMRKTNPDVRLAALAYSAYRYPPAEGVTLEPGMVLSYVDTYDSYREWSAWRRAGAELILRPNWWHIGVDAPHMPLQKQGNFFLYAHENGMQAFRFDQLYGYWGTQGANYYLIARLSARPDLSVEEVLDEYASAFGAAAPAIRKYLKFWEDFSNAAAYPGITGGELPRDPYGKYDLLVKEHRLPHHPLQGSWHVLPYLYTDEVLAMGTHHLDEAAEMAAGEGDEVRQRIEFLRHGIESLRATRDTMALGRELQKDRSPEAVKRFVDQYQKLRDVRREMTLRHVTHGDVQFRSEIRRGIPTTPLANNVTEADLIGL